MKSINLHKPIDLKMGISIDIADLKGNALQLKAQKDIVDPNRITLTSEEVEKLMSMEKLAKEQLSDKKNSADE
ncbi:MAG: hypothetical protein PHQ74_00060 [Crocinitomicaceae bacterium]|nr:hypothetical protein [Crocinitomicaceae bacterium]